MEKQTKIENKKLKRKKEQHLKAKQKKIENLSTVCHQ